MKPSVTCWLLNSGYLSCVATWTSPWPACFTREEPERDRRIRMEKASKLEVTIFITTSKTKWYPIILAILCQLEVSHCVRSRLHPRGGDYTCSKTPKSCEPLGVNSEAAYCRIFWTIWLINKFNCNFIYFLLKSVSLEYNCFIMLCFYCAAKWIRYMYIFDQGDQTSQS